MNDLKSKSNHSPQEASISRRIYARWMKFARFLARVNTAVILTLFYFLVIGPLAIFFKLVGKDLLDRRAEQRDSYWYEKPKVDHTLESTRHQF